MKKYKSCYLSKIIKIIDIFGKKIEFTINNNTSSKTVIGGILTSFSFFVIFIYFIYISQNFFNHTNPLIYNIEYHFPEPLNITDPINKIPLFISFRRDDINFNITKYFEIKSFYYEYSYIKNSITEQKEIPIEICNEIFFKNYSYLLDKNNINETLYCLNFHNENITLYGSTNTNNVGYMVIQLHYRNNINIKEIEDDILFNFTFFKLTLISSSIMTSFYKKPIVNFPLSYEMLLSPGFIKHRDLSMKAVELISDNGIIFENSKKYDYIAPENDEFYFSINANNNSLLAQYSIYTSNVYRHINRKYDKIQNILANLGGIINVIVQIMPFFASFFSVIQRDEKILRNFIRYEDKDFCLNNKNSNMSIYKRSVKTMYNQIFKNKNNLNNN